MFIKKKKKNPRYTKICRSNTQNKKRSYISKAKIVTTLIYILLWVSFLFLCRDIVSEQSELIISLIK